MNNKNAVPAGAVALLFSILLVHSGEAKAQNNRQNEVVTLVRSAMDSYSNLNMSAAQEALEEALSFSSEIDSTTLARVYSSHGIVWCAGVGDMKRCKEDFVTAICLDANSLVDPLYLTPEIQTTFDEAKAQANSDNCQAALARIEVPNDLRASIAGGKNPNGRPFCGEHTLLSEQKRKYELPFFVEVAPELRSSLKGMSVHYSFNASSQFLDLPMRQAGNGTSALLSCDEGQIRVADPATIAYYIEGYDSNGTVICGHGSPEEPIIVSMLSETTPLPPIAGMTAKECAPCAPWDKECGKNRGAKPGLNEPCQTNPGCTIGLVCGESGYCEQKNVGGSGTGAAPEKFYVSVSGGTGFGIIGKGWETKVWNASAPPISGVTGDTKGAIVTTAQNGGPAWNGIPARLAIGFVLSPKISLELAGRFDAFVVRVYEPRSCWEEYQSTSYPAGGCKPNYPVGTGVDPETFLSQSVVWDNEKQEPVYNDDYQFAWIVNARLQYRLNDPGKLGVSLFGGLGYGKVQYLVRQKDQSDIRFYPLFAGFDVEVGLGISYYFNKNVGVKVEVPIDLLLGHTFAANLDFTLGLALGF